MDRPTRLRVLWIVSLVLLSFAAEGLQNIVTSLIGESAIATQAGLVGTFTMGSIGLALCGNPFEGPPPPRRKRKPAAKPRVAKTRRKPVS